MATLPEVDGTKLGRPSASGDPVFLSEKPPTPASGR
eukprot:CAMPEP_0205890768 /NCGR_PEP_ID=MMETSP1083-20121108/21709_1 /ASSEMBLY_ACC=CAM_ASM_000430 /TAXON_ID=97485 /ORGANISM="Prymnesium parvum, Strain Texoma1" /LENGTH=35 /DNA_ID= /DNA_START= /DNA_END= /DNA_ORIENTATION=